MRTGVFLISGAAQYPFTKFVIADLIYCVVGVGVCFFGGSWLIELLKHVGYTAVWFVAVPAAIYGLYRYYHYLKRREIGPASVVEAATPVAINPAGAVPALRAATTMLKE
ncbi:MAG TPA: hypothetical protein VH092_27890, partial [Urbifossiella sp.]|nr:hypothetical protein [Urbifossiella sp.]